MPDIRFGDPVYLWLLALPAVLGVAWAWQVGRRRLATHRYATRRTTPVPERFTLGGELSFWLFVILALALVVGALTRPQVLVSVIQRTGVDFVVLQDGSTSMRVTDLGPDRWQRSVAWLRTFAEVLSWEDERVALALFAHRAAPQVRLTTDPNALFFFLDHLRDEPPFRLEDDTSWSTNIEEGLRWGVKMMDQDERLNGPRGNPRAFVVLSDGQAWSGEVDAALSMTRDRDIRVYVVGVGTTAGGLIPELPTGPYEAAPTPIHSSLDRQSLRAIARAGGGRYFELGAEPDQVLALRILDDVRRITGATRSEEQFAELYWFLLAGAAGALLLGTLFVTERSRLWWQLAGGVAVLIVFLN